jgi:hypothetical protein
MSVLDTNLVDYIYLESDGDVPVLVVNDPLSWRRPEEERHVKILREKLNAQIAFVETGQLVSVWPSYDGGPVRVQVVARHPLNDTAHAFYDLAREVMIESNIDLRVRTLDA